MSASTRRSTGPRARSPAASRAGRRLPRSCLRGSTSSCWTSRRTTWTSPGSTCSSASCSAVEGGVVLVSHDRALLDRTVNRIVELESGTQRVHHYAGGWSEFEAAREHARAEHERAFAHWSEERGRFTRLHRDRREQARVGGKQANRRGTHALMSKTRAAARRARVAGARPGREALAAVGAPTRPRTGGALGRSRRLSRSRRPRARLVPARADRRATSAGESGSRLPARTAAGKTTLLDGLLGRLELTAGTRRVGPAAVFGEIGQARALFAADRAFARLVLRGGRDARKRGSDAAGEVRPLRKPRPPAGREPLAR